MSRHSELLKANRPAIAAQAVRAAGCEPSLTPAAEAVVDAAAAASAGDAPLSAEAVSSVSEANGLRERLLRAVETSCLDCLYQHEDDEETRSFAQGLRARFRTLYPRDSVPAPHPFFARFDAFEESADAQEAQLHFCLSTLLASMVEMVYIHDESGALHYVNERCSEVTGYSREELLAPMNIQDFLPPEFSDLVADRLATLGAGRQSPFTLEILNQWGRRVPLEFTLHHLPLELTPGAPQDFVLVCAHDCHLSRRLEHRIEQMDDLENRVLLALPVGILITDADFVITEANPSAVKSIGAEHRDELVGKRVYSLCSDEDPAMRARLENVASTGQEWHSEWHGRTRFGGDMHNELVVIPLGGDRGGLIIVLRDIKKEVGRNHAQVQAQKLQALGTTIAGVSHELNNPLTGIVGYTQLLLASDIAPSVRARVDHIAMEARRAQRIVQNLLTFAQRQETRKTLHDVNEVVRNVLTLQEYQLRVDGIQVRMDLAPDLPETLIDVNALQTVCLHIVNNAHQALIESGKEEKALTVRSVVTDNLIQLEFKDTGPGISPDNQARIFDPFFTTREPGAGPGLGLSVSYGIVQDHGGQILLSSTEGVGSTFTIVLPIREASAKDTLIREP